MFHRFPAGLRPTTPWRPSPSCFARSTTPLPKYLFGRCPGVTRGWLFDPAGGSNGPYRNNYIYWRTLVFRDGRAIGLFDLSCRQSDRSSTSLHLAFSDVRFPH